ncbi:hypothetical protein HYFRA_00002558 [Hymenoscyphus fraxineus]|uniref:ferric-chelate reductase (NADPH) n=1 Tax=Hymenoscyphus fraxineus TaxID=746836 RepID=A0A9N9LAM8_9HELO|nr:hypothetical protein HYFRA_00002558 [Hymenoscyphus fraxineus]
MPSISPRHDHNAMGGEMAMGDGVPGLFYMQRIFWAFVGSSIAVATLANVINKIICRQRISVRQSPSAAKPTSLFFKSHATLSAIIREYSNYSIPVSIKGKHFYLSPVGLWTILVGYLVLIVDFAQFEDIGYRAGFIAVCQLPLIILLSGKRNIIGFLTGAGYERLSWLHRWTARALLFTVLIHLGYFLTVWGKYDYIMTKLRTDALTQRGVAAGGVLLWLVLSSWAPIRGLSYEVFVVQHIISWIGFFVALTFHIPAENKIWLWLPIAFWGFDRMARAAYMIYGNLSVFHTKSSGFLACKASFEPLDETHTRITISNPPITWRAGQHLFLTDHFLAPLTSHPFTIASLPEDGKLEFVVRAKKGATKKFYKYAESVNPLLPLAESAVPKPRSVLIDGPYSRIRPLRQFESLVFIAGSTGATFTVPLMRDIVQQWVGKTNTSWLPLSMPAGAVTRHVRFVWVVKKTASVRWFSSQLNDVVREVDALRNEGHDIAIEISVYVTCDDAMTSPRPSITGEESRFIGQATSGREDQLDEKNTAYALSQEPTSDCECGRLVTDQDAITTICNCASKRQSDSNSSTSSLEKSDRLVHPRINLLTGRPDVSNIIRTTAELALGEMAVVVCGPPGLVQRTRNAAVAISDDRAVHKGTGAQGIYVHAETFGYA